MASSARASILTGVAVAGMLAVELLASTGPVPAGVLAVGRTGAVLLVAAVLVWRMRVRMGRWVDTRLAEVSAAGATELECLTKRVDENHRAVAWEVGRLRCVARGVVRGRPRWAEQDTVEFRPVPWPWQLAAVRGQLEIIEGRLANVEGRIEVARREEERAAGFVDGVRDRYLASLDRRQLPPPSWPTGRG